MKKNLNKTISAIAATVVLFGSAAGAVMAESGYVHGRTLKMGSRGESVKMLQEALNSCFGSDMTADGVFGRGTKKEVMSAQKELGLRGDGVVGRMTGMKIAECEAEEETTTGTGTPATGTTTTTPATTPDDLTKFTSGKGMELRYRNFQVRNASNSQVEEGAKGVEVARATFDVQQSDALLERLNINALPTATTYQVTKPWRVYDKLTVMVNGKEAGSVMTNNSSAWDEVAANGAVAAYYKLTIGGLATVVKKDTTADIRIVADLNSGANGDTNATSVMWRLAFPNQAFRATDEAAITQYVPTDLTSPVTSYSEISIKNVGSLTNSRISVGSNDPKSTTFEAKKTATSSDYTIQEYTIKAEDGDIKIKTLPITLRLKKAANGTQTASTTTVSTADYGTQYKAIIDSAWVTINGERYDSVISKSNMSDNVSASAANYEDNMISFDVNRRVTIKAGETATVKVMVKFKSLPETLVASTVTFPYTVCAAVTAGTPSIANAAVTTSVAGSFASCESGAQITAMTPATSNFALENGTGDTISTFTGSATGYAHTVRTTGLIAVMGTPTITKATSTSTGLTPSVSYSIPVKVTAIGNTFYGSQSACANDTVAAVTAIGTGATAGDRGACLATNLAAYVLQKSAAPTTSSFLTGGNTSFPTATISSDAPLTTSGNFRFDDGSTKTVTLNVTVTGMGTTGLTESIRVALKQLNVYTDSALTTGTTVISLIPSESFQTNYETITR